MARRRRGRPLNGILVLDKPAGASSNDAVQRAKRLFDAQKVGHTGSLDPLATGVLPLCFGEATKFSQYLLASNKRYWARIKLGERTDSGDADGKVVESRCVQNISKATVEAQLSAFRGDIQQTPSMYSALKHNGQPLYKLARQGIEVERQARTVSVFENTLVALDEEFLELEIHCSKGTYVRSIAEDLGEALGCGAHVVALRRRSAGPYLEAQAVGFEALEALAGAPERDALLMPVATAVWDWPELKLSEDTAYYLKRGQPVIVPHAPTSGWVRLTLLPDAAPAGTPNDESTEIAHSRADDFIGVGEVLEDGRIAPRRLVVQR